MFKKKLGVLILAILIFGIPKTSFAEPEFNSFQQIINYIANGDSSKNQRKKGKILEYNPEDPLQQRRSAIYIRKAKIFNKERCIAGWAEIVKKYRKTENSKEYTKIYWNSVNVKDIEIKTKDGDKLLMLWGKPFTKEYIHEDWTGFRRHRSYRTRGGLLLGESKYYNDGHLVKALKILFSKYCTEFKRRTIEEAKKTKNRAKARTKAKTDSFQQIMNYLFVGNPFTDEMKGSFTVGTKNRRYIYRAKISIFDRKDCIAGWETSGVSFKIYWNNVDLSSIQSQDKIVHDKWIKHLVISGDPHIAHVNNAGRFSMNTLALGLLTKDIKRLGFFSSLAIPLNQTEKYDNERLKKALRLLYSKHCTGLKRKSAF